MRCPGCNQLDTRLSPTPDGHRCQVCLAAGRDPVMWLLEAVEAGRAAQTEQKMLRRVPSGSESIRLDRAGNMTRGLASDAIVIGLGLSGDDIVLGYRIARWIDGGVTALSSVIGEATYIEMPGILRDQVEKTWRYVDQNLIDCAGTCRTALTADAVAGRHFAGVYCSPCWEAYKAQNSQRYGCGCRAYECTC